MGKEKYSHKLCLGTVQLGMRYGVNNALGRQPTQEECFDILQTALDMGIDCFDTASAYGNAEELLGAFGLASKYTKEGTPVRIISKLRPECENSGEAVLQEIRSTLRRLKADSLYGYMLHRASDMGKNGIMAGLASAKEIGLVQKVGVSIYAQEEAMGAVHHKSIDMIQIPCNVLDHRLERANFFSAAMERGVEVYARSAFLQGLLLMEPEQAEKRVQGSGRYIELLRDVAEKHGFSVQEAAFLFVFCHPGISRTVFGVDESSQLRENCRIVEQADAFEDCRRDLDENFASLDIPDKVLLPNLWTNTQSKG